MLRMIEGQCGDWQRGGGGGGEGAGGVRCPLSDSQVSDNGHFYFESLLIYSKLDSWHEHCMLIGVCLA